MKKKYKLGLILIAILIVLILVTTIIFLLNNNKKVEKTKVVDSIDNFSYTLDDRDTKLMKDTYNELKDVLNKDQIDYELYAKTLAKLFVIDLFTMNNKINKYDVGSTEYIYPESVDNFKLNVEDTIYKSMEDNSDGKRKQDLPEVISVDVANIEEVEFEIKEEIENVYEVNLTWQYEKDLGYDDDATIKLLKVNDKLYVVEYTTGEQKNEQNK